MIEPPVGASTCASGSQVCRGQSGTFTRKARAKAPKRSASVPGARCQAPEDAARVQSAREKLWIPVAWRWTFAA